MCYDIKASLEAQKSRAVRSGNLNAVQEIERLLQHHTKLPQTHLNGFNHPVLGLYTNESNGSLSLGRWGLVPHWFAGAPEALKFNTLNARSESMFDKAAFAQAAEQYRGILMIDGFYEHQHRSSGIYPYFIYRKDHEPMAVACIYEPMPHDDDLGSTQLGALNTKKPPLSLSFSIVTIAANTLMSGIHNNPKLKQARMPLILTPEMEDLWLLPELHKSEAFTTSTSHILPHKGLNEKFVRQSQEIELDCHTVAPLRTKSGKIGQGNGSMPTNDASLPFEYPELGQEWDLFSGLN